MGGLKERQGGRSSSVAARLTGSLSCSLLELCVFHGIDTAGKRIMTYNGRLLTADVSMSEKKRLLQKVVFRENMDAPLGTKIRNLYPGFRFAVLYKVCQRTTTYGCQPFLYDYLNRNHAQALQQAFGRWAQPATYSLAGGLMGTLEVIFLPADTLKIIAQTNKGALRDRSTLEIVRNEGLNLYRGGVCTAMRNFPGSVGMFGGSALIKDALGLTNYNQATVGQEILASCAAAIMSLTLSSPFDVIKARVQRSSIDAHMTGSQHLRQLLAVEGPCALFKGLSTKMIVVGPKLMLSFTVFNQVMAATDRWLNQSTEEGTRANVAVKQGSGRGGLTVSAA